MKRGGGEDEKRGGGRMKRGGGGTIHTQGETIETRRLFSRERLSRFKSTFFFISTF